MKRLLCILLILIFAGTVWAQDRTQIDTTLKARDCCGNQSLDSRDCCGGTYPFTVDGLNTQSHVIFERIAQNIGAFFGHTAKPYHAVITAEDGRFQLTSIKPMYVGFDIKVGPRDNLYIVTATELSNQSYPLPPSPVTTNKAHFDWYIADSTPLAFHIEPSEDEFIVTVTPVPDKTSH
jgi:hypothetical protein